MCDSSEHICFTWMFQTQKGSGYIWSVVKDVLRQAGGILVLAYGYFFAILIHSYYWYPECMLPTLKPIEIL